MALVTNPHENIPFVRPETTSEPRKSHKGLFAALGAGVVTLVAAGVLYAGTRGGGGETGPSAQPEQPNSPGAEAPIAAGEGFNSGELPGVAILEDFKTLEGKDFPEIVFPSSNDPQIVLEQLHTNYYNSQLYIPQAEQAEYYGDWFWYDGSNTWFLEYDADRMSHSLYAEFKDFIPKHPEAAIDFTVEVLDDDFEAEPTATSRQVLARINKSLHYIDADTGEQTSNDESITEVFTLNQKLVYSVNEDGEFYGQPRVGWFVVTRIDAEPGQTTLN